MANNDNIIYAKFNHGREITTDSRSQYAYGQVLQISGLHLPASFDADVSNKGDKQAVQRIGTDNELPIDDAFFLSGKDVIVMINASFISPNVNKITSFKVHFSPRQEGSGDPSPENVRNIVGWNGVNITQECVENITNEYSIDWTDSVGTIYGGYVDLVSGELVQTHYKLIADGINGKVVNNFYKDENRDIFGFRVIRNYFNPIGIPGTGSTIICDSLPILYNKYQSQVPFIYSYSNGNRYAILYCGKLSEHPELVETEDYQAFVNAWLVEHPLTFVYKLETPIHYQLTPQQLTALRGTNTIYSNTNGQTEIKYWKH